MQQSTLDLSYLKLTDAKLHWLSWQVIAPSPSLSSPIQKLNLNGNLLSGDNLFVLLNPQCFPQLQEVTLNNNSQLSPELRKINKENGWSGVKAYLEALRKQTKNNPPRH